MRRPTLLLPAAPLVAALLAGCGTAGAGPVGRGPDGRLEVVATTTQVADFTREVAGGEARVTQLLKPNVDPHEHEVSPADVTALARADVVVLNGVGLEAGWLDPALRASGFAGRRVDTSAGLQLRHGDGSDEQAAGDPHVWHDPRNAEVMVGEIAQALAAADPVHAAAFAARAAAYRAQLVQLDAGIAREIATLAPQDRELVTNHDAFGYYVARYGLRFVGSVVPSFDTAAALSGAQLNDLVRRVRATGTKAVFSESSLPADAAQALAREAGVRVEAGPDALYGDTLGPAGSSGATYLQMERHNTDVVVAALR